MGPSSLPDHRPVLLCVRLSVTSWELGEGRGHAHRLSLCNPGPGSSLLPANMTASLWCHLPLATVGPQNAHAYPDFTRPGPSPSPAPPSPGETLGVTLGASVSPSVKWV